MVRHLKNWHESQAVNIQAFSTYFMCFAISNFKGRKLSSFKTKFIKRTAMAPSLSSFYGSWLVVATENYTISGI